METSQIGLFLLPRPIQELVLNHLTIQEMNNLSRVNQAYFQLWKERGPFILKKTLMVIRSFNNSKLKDHACLSLLKSYRSTPPLDELKVEAIQTISNSYLKCCKLLAISCTFVKALDQARETAEKIENEQVRSYAFLEIFKISKKEQDLKRAKNTIKQMSNPFIQAQALIEVFKNTIIEDKNKDLLIEKVRNLANTHLPVSSLNFEQFETLLKLTMISSNPQQDLIRAKALINQFDGIDQPHLLFQARLDMILYSLKVPHLLEEEGGKELLEDDLELLTLDIQKIFNHPTSVAEYWIYKGVKNALSINLNLARWLAHQIPSPSKKDELFLQITEISQDRKDLEVVTELSHEAKERIGKSDKLLKAVKLVLKIFKDLSLAKQIAHQMESISNNEFDKDFHQFKAFLEIFKVSQEQSDFKKAKELALKISYSVNRFKAFKKLYRFVKDENFLKIAIDQSLIIQETQERDVAYIELALLTKKIEYLEQSIESVKLWKKEDWKSQTLVKIIKISIKNFKNFDLARKVIHSIDSVCLKKEAMIQLASASKDLQDFQQAKEILTFNQLEKLLLKITKKLILQKQFEQVQLFDQSFYLYYCNGKKIPCLTELS